MNTKSSIAFLFDKGKTFYYTPLKVTWAKNTENSFPLAVLFSVSKRNFANAPDRNKLKRLMRESYRKNKKEIILQLADKNLNIQAAFFYNTKNAVAHAEMETAMKACLKKLADEVAAATA